VLQSRFYFSIMTVAMQSINSYNKSIRRFSVSNSNSALKQFRCMPNSKYLNSCFFLYAYLLHYTLPIVIENITKPHFTITIIILWPKICFVSNDHIIYLCAIFIYNIVRTLIFKRRFNVICLLNNFIPCHLIHQILRPRTRWNSGDPAQEKLCDAYYVSAY
jgi:hypothetical protein